MLKKKKKMIRQITDDFENSSDNYDEKQIKVKYQDVFERAILKMYFEAVFFEILISKL